MEFWSPCPKKGDPCCFRLLQVLGGYAMPSVGQPTWAALCYSLISFFLWVCFVGFVGVQGYGGRDAQAVSTPQLALKPRTESEGLIPHLFLIDRLQEGVPSFASLRKSIAPHAAALPVPQMGPSTISLRLQSTQM